MRSFDDEKANPSSTLKNEDKDKRIKNYTSI